MYKINHYSIGFHIHTKIEGNSFLNYCTTKRYCLPTVCISPPLQSYGISFSYFSPFRAATLAAQIFYEKLFNFSILVDTP